MSLRVRKRWREQPPDERRSQRTSRRVRTARHGRSPPRRNGTAGSFDPPCHTLYYIASYSAISTWFHPAAPTASISSRQPTAWAATARACPSRVGCSNAATTLSAGSATKLCNPPGEPFAVFYAQRPCSPRCAAASSSGSTAAPSACLRPRPESAGTRRRSTRRALATGRSGHEDVTTTNRIYRYVLQRRRRGEMGRRRQLAMHESAAEAGAAEGVATRARAR